MANANDLKSAACTAIDIAKSDLNDISQLIWKSPEVSFEEHEAHKNLTEFLSKYGFSVQRNHITDTGFRSTYGSGGPTVAILCEYDALPEVGHACGHNLIAEVGVAASIGIKAAIDLSGGTLGKLVILGTPAEEGGGGKLGFIEQGEFDDVDCALMAHPYPTNVTKVPIVARSTVYVTYHGKASHASGFPWEGVNALDAAVLAYNNISCLRQQLKPTWRVHGIIRKGGAKPNIIPEETQLVFCCRTPTMTELKVLEEKTTQCFQAAATATGCKVELRWGKKTYASMIYNHTLCNLMEQRLDELKVDYTTVPTDNALVSTDMGNVSHVVPSIHPFFHIGTDAAIHTRGFTEAAGSPKAQPHALTYGKALAMVAIDVMSDAKLMSQVKEDFKREKAEQE